MKTGEIYISVDVEAAGPIPGKFSMLSLGACVVGKPEECFYIELKPINEDFVLAALNVSGLDFAKLVREGTSPDQAMKDFQQWILKVAGKKKPVFVGFNACFDWQFVNWYFCVFTEGNPFGFAGLDIKSFYMGRADVAWSRTTSSQLPQQFQPDTPQTHNSLDDAKAQASIFKKLLSSSRALD